MATAAAILWGLAGGWAPARAQALPPVSVQRFRPSVDAGRLWTVDRAGDADDPASTGVVVAHWAANPLVYRDAAGEERGLVTDVLQLDVAGGWQIGRVRAGAVVPAVLFAQGADRRGAGLGDVA